MSNMDITELIELAQERKLVNSDLRQKLNQRKESNQISNSIRLPQVLYELSGVQVIPFQIAQPNFITTKTVEGDLYYAKSVKEIKTLADKIVLIENADPGFDFIFNYPIKGLITKYGGSNSHMAIRCAEFGLPGCRQL